MKLTIQQAVYAAYTARSLADAIMMMVSSSSFSKNALRGNRLLGRRMAAERLSDPNHPEFLERVRWAKNQVRTGGLGEFYNSPSRTAKAEILLAVRVLRRDSKQMMALAIALGGDKMSIGIASLTAPTPQTMAGKAIEILLAQGWRNKNRASNIFARFTFDGVNNTL